MIIPTSCVLEFVFQGKRYSPQILTTVVMVLVGVGAACAPLGSLSASPLRPPSALPDAARPERPHPPPLLPPPPPSARRTVSDVTLSLGGAIVAFISVITMSAQQVLAAVIQQRYNMKADAFVAHVAPLQAVILIAIGPFLDRLIVGGWPWDIFHEDTQKLPVTLFFVVLSSAVAILVNLSQAMAIGVASAVAFQVLGHSKTVLVLLIAWLFFDSSWTARHAAPRWLPSSLFVVFSLQGSRQASPLPRLGSRRRQPGCPPTPAGA